MDAGENRLCLRCKQPESAHVDRKIDGAGQDRSGLYCADLYGMFVSKPGLSYTAPLHGPLPTKTVLRMMATLADVPALRRAALKGQGHERK